MIENEDTAAGFFLRIGPFQTREQREHVSTVIQELSAEGRAAAGDKTALAHIVRALSLGLEALAGAPGHFTLRADGGPGVPATVELATGGKYRADGERGRRKAAI